MNIKQTSTRWVLFLSSSHPQAELRHVLDLVFGLLCLEQAGINPKDIFIYVDCHPGQADSIFKLSSNYDRNIKGSSDFFEDIKNNTYENMVMFVTGHGSLTGIDAVNTITPAKLVDSIKNMPNLRNGVVYLGQCYAGLFNYVNAGRSGREEPDIIFLGATNLHESLSSPTTEQFIFEPITWSANLFLLHIFKWFSSPKDIDGDGNFTIMDSYKYAGVMSNMHHKDLKSKGLLSMLDMHQEYKILKDASDVDGISDEDILKNKVECEAVLQNIQLSLNLHHVHQECWILNSRPAQWVYFQ